MQPMQTIKYMGFYIHLGGPSLGDGCLIMPDFDQPSVNGACGHSPKFGAYKSLHAAKCAIAKYWRKGLTTEQYKQLKKG